MAALPRMSQRLRILRTLEKEPHRYPRVRHVTMAITFAALFAVPLLGLARFDLWDGRHMWAGSRTNFVYGFGAVMISVVVFYLMTFVVNGIVGRLFCGFGCPVGQMSRMSDSAEVAQKSGEKRFKAEAEAILFAFGLAAAGLLWFCDPRVFVEGSRKAILMASGGLVGGTAIVYLLGRYVRWSFCRGYCPIGIYYSAVQTAHSFGIHYDEVESLCKGCDYCVQACPVGLNPRDLRKPMNDVIGVAIEGLPQVNHCLTCGECVRACENVFVHKPDIIPPLSLSRKNDKRRPDGDQKPGKGKKPIKPEAKPDGEDSRVAAPPAAAKVETASL